MQIRYAAAAISAFIALIVVLTLWSGTIGHNDSTNFQILQGITGSITVIDEPGYYWKGFGKVYTYPRTTEAKYEHSPDKTLDRSIRVTFNDSGNADVGAYVRVQLPTTTDKRLLLHRDFQGSVENIKSAIHAHLVNCAKASAPVMSASENQSSRKAEFNQIVEEQLVQGLYKMRRTTIELEDLSEIEEVGVDANGNKITKEKKARVQATEIVSGKDGKPIVVQVSPLTHYDLTVLQFSITETEYDEATLRQFAAKKESYLNAEKSKAQRQEEVQQRLMVEEKGRRLVAEIQAEENQKKERAIIQAQQAAEVAVIEKDRAVTQGKQKTEVAEQARKEAETLKQIAAIKAETAELDKKAAISLAEAQQKAIELGGGISERERVLAEIAKDRDIGMSEHIAKANVPGVMIIGGKDSGGDGSALTNNLFNLLLMKSNGLIKDPKPAAQPSTK